MPDTDSRLRHYLVVIAILLAGLWLRVGDLASLPPGLSSDESMNANDAFHIARVGPARFPFYENYGEPEPLFRFILSAFVPFFGAHVWTLRLTSALVGVVTLASAYWTTRQVLAWYAGRRVLHSPRTPAIAPDSRKGVPDRLPPNGGEGGDGRAGRRALPVHPAGQARAASAAGSPRIARAPLGRVGDDGSLAAHRWGRARSWAACAAAASLAAALGHITLTRGLYRAVPLPLFILLFIGLLVRGLRRKSLGSIALSGSSLALGYYTYTAGFVIPLAFGPFVLGLILFERKRWRAWAASLAVAGLVAAALLAPVAYLLVKSPERVLGRAAEMTGTSVTTADSAFDTISARVSSNFQLLIVGTYKILLVGGDGNVQYNTDSAPVIPFMFQPLFLLGLLALVIQWRRPPSWLLAALVFITAAPAVLSIEPSHGLRITGAFAIFPIVVGLGADLLLGLSRRLPASARLARPLLLGSLAALAVWGVAWARQTYVSFWQKPSSIIMYGRDLTYGEWFFRPDQRDLAQWIRAQRTPVLVPVDQLLPQTTHAWLLAHYPSVAAAGDSFAVPPDTTVVIPWALELGDYDLGDRHYALLYDRTITLLPPLARETHRALVASFDSAPSIRRPNGNPLAKVVTPGSGFRFGFEPPGAAGTLDRPLASPANGLLVTSWWGPAAVSGDSEQTLTYMLDWATREPQQHDYRSFVGLLTYDNDRKAGVDADMTRWLYPTWTWRPNTPTPVTYTFTVPAGLDPGAYRLAVIMQDELNTIGWVKVPQTDPPSPEAGVAHPMAVFNDEFVLYGVSAREAGDGRIGLSLFWQSQVERPLTDAIIFIHAQTSDGRLIAQTDAQPWQGRYPTFIWSKGERVGTDYVLSLGGTPPDEVEIWVGMYTFPSLARLRVTQAGVPVKDDRLRVGGLGDLIGR